MDRVTFKSEKTLGELADRVYGTRYANAATRARVEDALLKANPHAADFETLADAAPIVVPKVEGIAEQGTAHPLELGLSELVAQVTRTLGGARAALDEAAARKVTATTEAVTYVQSKKYRTLAKEQLPAETVDKVVADTKARAAQAKVLKTFQAEAMTQLENDLQELGGLFSALATRALASYSAAPHAEQPAVKDDQPQAEQVKYAAAAAKLKSKKIKTRKKIKRK